MLKQVLKTFVAVLAIAAAATGPARAQSNPTKYTSAVAMSALQVGDTLAEGFSLTGNESNLIYLVANRHKHNENLSSFLESINLDWIQSIGANCVFSTLVNEQSITFAPVDENGQDCDAWVVTGDENVEGFTNITIAGIRIPGPLYTLDSIPLGWQVKIGNAEPVYPTAYTEGNTSLGHLTISETDSVELIPPADVKPNVKSVTLVEEGPAVQTVDIDGLNLLIAPGDTWKQIAQRNNGVIDASGNGVWWGDNQLQSQHVNIQSTSTYDSSLVYSWYEW